MCDDALSWDVDGDMSGVRDWLACVGIGFCMCRGKQSVSGGKKVVMMCEVSGMIKKHSYLTTVVEEIDRVLFMCVQMGHRIPEFRDLRVAPSSLYAANILVRL